jgi:hypothetical protein
MPAVSKAQQKFMGMVHAAQKGDMKNPSPEVEKAADSMSDKSAKDFASTKHKGLPDHVKEGEVTDRPEEPTKDDLDGMPSAAVAGVSAESVKPQPTNNILWTATGKVCEGRSMAERVKMYEKKGGGWRMGKNVDETVYTTLKEFYKNEIKPRKEAKELIVKRRMGENILKEDLDALGLLIPALGALIGGGLAQLYPYFTGHPNIYTNIKDWWKSKKDNSEMNKIANRIKNDPDVQEFLKKKNKSGWKEMLKKKLSGSELNYLNKIYRSRFNNESINEDDTNQEPGGDVVASNGTQDHEVSMAKASLISIGKAVNDLMGRLGDKEKDIPGWIQDHITNAENYIVQASKGYYDQEDKKLGNNIQRPENQLTHSNNGK